MADRILHAVAVSFDWVIDMALHWAAQYIGRPWVNGGRDIQSGVDCWGLLCHVYRQHYNINLPVFIGVDAADNRAVAKLMNQHDQWRELPTPMEGCAVALSKNKALHHVGLYVCGRVLHAMEGQGVVSQTVATLTAKGWTTIRYFQHEGMA